MFSNTFIMIKGLIFSLNNNIKQIIHLNVLILGISGCGPGTYTVPLLERQLDAKLKTFSTSHNLSGIYIYRNRFSGPAAKIEVSIDGKPIGKTASFTYLYNDITPGKHIITAVACKSSDEPSPCKGWGYPENTFNLEVDIKKGFLTYIWLEHNIGFIGGAPKLYLVSEEEGKQGVLESNLGSTIQLTLEQPEKTPSSSPTNNSYKSSSLIETPQPLPQQILSYTNEDARTALVIGNSTYKFAPELRNPENDANDMSTVLKRLGFHVIVLLNANQQKMDEAITDLGKQLENGGVGLFFYAGHGAQVNGENYLIPVDANIKSEADVKYKAVNAGQVLAEMGGARNGMNIIILDACRNNPFPRTYRSFRSGLAEMEAPQGSIIAFATAPGNVASDGEERNGLYTQHILKNIETPNLPIELMFKKVLQGVNSSSKGNQTPWTSSSFTGDFYFK